MARQIIRAHPANPALRSPSVTVDACSGALLVIGASLPCACPIHDDPMPHSMALRRDLMNLVVVRIRYKNIVTGIGGYPSGVIKTGGRAGTIG